MKSNLGKERSWMHQGRSHSPNSFGPQRTTSATNISVHSQHLWNMLEDVELFPEQIHQLFRHEERNLSSCKRAIEREKIKAAQQLEHLKKEIVHNIDDLKISILSELDRVYRTYMEKYATLKAEIVQIKKMKDQIEMDIGRRSALLPRQDARQPSTTSNAGIMRSLEKNNLQVKKYQMLNYIAQLQREKIIPLSTITKELIILTQYENNYFQTTEFQQFASSLVADLKANIRSLYDRKNDFIRQPDQICLREEEPILNGIYEQIAPQPTQQYNSPFGSSPFGNPSFGGISSYQISNPLINPQKSRLEDPKIIQVATQQQSVSVQWAQSLSLQQKGAIKCLGEEIILCAVQVGKNIIAVGSKDGQINIYQTNSGKRIANPRGHRASICKLAIVEHGGRKLLASGSDYGCNSIVLWDTNTWNMKMRIESHKAAVTAIVDLQDGRSMVSGSYDKTINVYDLGSDGKILYNLPVNKASVTAILMNSTGSKMISCGLQDESLNIWQIVRGTGKIVETMFLERIIQNNTTICSLVASSLQPDVVLLGGKDGKVKLINIDRGQAYKTIPACVPAAIQMVLLERNSKPDYPIIICWPCKQEGAKIINSQSGRIQTMQLKGQIEFGCGIGPKAFFLSGGRQLGMLSQSRQRRQVTLFDLSIS